MPRWALVQPAPLGTVRVGRVTTEQQSRDRLRILFFKETGHDNTTPTLNKTKIPCKDVDDGNGEKRDQSGEVHRPRRIPTSVKPTKEDIDEQRFSTQSVSIVGLHTSQDGELDRDTCLWRSSRDPCLQVHGMVRVGEKAT